MAADPVEKLNLEIDNMKPLGRVDICQDSTQLDHSNTSFTSTTSCSGYETSDTNQDLGDSFDGNAMHQYHLHLLDLPPEVLLHMSTFLESRFVVKTLTLVCKVFQRLFSQESTWKIRISKRWPKRYPVLHVDDDKFNWKKACIEREDTYRLWSQHDTKMENFSLNSGHFAAIDSVHLMQGGDICISGSRDRTISIWDLRKLDTLAPNEPTLNAKVKSLEKHTGWVWSMTSLGNTLCTASWDCKVKFWDMEAGGVEIQSIKGKSANLCMAYNADSLIVGSFDKKVTIYDPRAGYGVIKTLIQHQKPVLCLVADDNYIVSGSEDNTVVVYDRRAGEILKRVELQKYKFPMSMSYSSEYGQLWIGEKRGLLHLMDARHGNFDIVQTYDVGHTGKLTGVLHNLGCLVTCSYDKTVKIHEPNADPGNICTLEAHSGEVADIYMMNNVLVSGSSDMSVHVWRPKTTVDSDETDCKTTSQSNISQLDSAECSDEPHGAIGGENVNIQPDNAIGGEEVRIHPEGVIGGEEGNTE
ncbi:F-box/WD repeat-containing protein 9-like [Glandiceps talaboti]